MSANTSKMNCVLVTAASDSVVELLGNVLHEHGYETIICTSSFDAVHSLTAKESCDIIIAELPGLDKTSIIETTRRFSNGNAIPVVVLSDTCEMKTTKIPGGGLIRIIPANTGMSCIPLAVEMLLFANEIECERKEAIQTARVKSIAETDSSFLHSDALFKSIVDSAPSLLIITDTKGNHLYVSPNCESFLGYTQKELLEKVVWYVHEDDSDRIRRIYDDSLKNRKSGSNVEYKAVRKNGEIWYASTSWEPIFDNNGGFAGFVLQTIDITKRKQFETALIESEERYRLLVESSPGSIMILEKGKFVYANPTALSLLGYSDINDLIGREATESVALISRSAAHDRIQRTENGLSNIPAEMTLVRPDGTQIQVLSTSVSGTLNGRQVTIVMGQDITARREVESALAKSREALWKAQNLAHLGNYSWDITTGEAEWSDEMFNIFSCYGEKPTHDLVLSLMHPDDRKRVIDNALVRSKTKERVNIDYRIIRPDGTIRYVQDLAEIDYTVDGKPIKVFGTVLDITDRKLAEIALRDSEEKYRTLLDNIPDIIMRFDRDIRHVYVSANSENLTGKKQDELIGKTLEESGFPSNILAYWDANIRSVFETGKPFEDMFEYANKYVEWRMTPEKDTDGAIQSVLAIGRNLTEQREVEAEFTSLFNKMLDGFALHEIILDDNGKPVDYVFLKVNPSFEKMTGFKSDEIVGKTVLDVMPLTEEYWIKTYGKVALTGEPTVFEDYSGALDKYFEVHAYCPKINQFAVIVRDITERKRIEAELNERENWLTSILMASPVGIGASQHRIIRIVNDRITEMTGYSREELIGRNIRILYATDEDYTYVGNEKYRLLKEHSIDTVETSWRHKNGSIIDILLSLSYIDPNNPDTGVTFTALDITESKQAVKALRASEARFRTLFEHSPAGVAIFNMTGKCLLSNDTLHTMLGYSGEELTALDFTDITYPEDMERSRDVFRQITDGVIDRQLLEKRLIHKDGHIVWVNQAISATSTVKESGTTIISIFTDITNIKELQNQLRQSQKMEAIGTLAGGIAHDFNNILSIINGYSELALNEIDEEDIVRRDVEEILRASIRARDLVSQILTISRQQKEEERRPLQLSVIVKETIKFLRASLPSTIEIHQKIDPTVKLILADPVQMHQVLMNLCTNAAHAMKEKGGTLEISLGMTTFDGGYTAKYPDLEPGDYTILSVRDTGKGIPADILDRIFEPYFTTKEKGEGTGLGLAVVHGIVHGCRGLVTVESEIGTGTVFRVFLPAVEGQESYQQEDAVVSIGGSERILFVDDEPMIAAAEERSLSRLGYSVTVVVKSIDALNLIRRDPNRFDIVITDMTMPKMTGLELAHEIESIRPDLPVVICSGYHDMLVTGNIAGNNIKKILAKPVTIKNLSEAIRSILDE